MKIESLVTSIAEDLNDNEAGHAYTVWSASQIRRWIIEAYNVVYDRRPDIFLDRVIIQITACSIIQNCDICEAYRTVLGETTKDGRLIKLLPRIDKDAALDWRGKSCIRGTQDKGYLQSYAIDTVSDTLYVWPEISSTVDAYVLVECAIRPKQDTAEIKDEAQAAIVQWVMYRARSMDAEISASALQTASSHYNAFFTVLNLPIEASNVIHSKG